MLLQHLPYLLAIKNPAEASRGWVLGMSIRVNRNSSHDRDKSVSDKTGATRRAAGETSHAFRLRERRDQVVDL